MKRLICLFLAGWMLLSAAACTTKHENTQTEAPTEAPVMTEAPTPEPTEAPTPEPTEEPEQVKTVSVSTVEEFLAAIAPDTEIVLSGGTYDLSAAADAYAGNNPYASFVYSDYWVDGDRFLKLAHIDGLCIRAEDGAECILAAKNCEAVLCAESCAGLTLSGITFRGDEEGISLQNCTDVRVDRCAFESQTAIYAIRCEGLTLADSEISGCLLAVFVSDSKDVTVSDMTIHDCGMALSIGSCENVLVSGCKLHDCWRPEEPLPDEPQGDASYWICVDGRSNDVRFSDCEIYGNECTFLFGIYSDGSVDFTDLRMHDNDVGILFSFDEVADEPSSHAISDCEIGKNTIGSFLSCGLSGTQIALSGTSVHDNAIDKLFRGGDITVTECAFSDNDIGCWLYYDEEYYPDVRASVHDSDGNELGEDAFTAVTPK